MSISCAFIVPHPPLIIPAVGKGEQKKTQKTIDAYEKVGQKIAAAGPATIIVISPHSAMYSDYIHISPGNGARGSFDNFGAPHLLIEKKYDSNFVTALTETAKNAGIAAGPLGERDKNLDHGVLVPLYFVEQYCKDYELVRISVSGLSFLEHYNFGKCIAQTAESLNRKVVLLASGDLSHKLNADSPYGFAKEGPLFDEQAVTAMKSADFMRFLTFDETFCEAAAECGLRSFIEMAGALDGKALKSEFLSYEGPFGVGYALCGFSVTGSDSNRCFGDRYRQELEKKRTAVKQAEDEYVRLARQSLERHVRSGEKIKRPAGLSHDLQSTRAGVFVSLKKEGRLRGCIGTIVPTTACIADEIIRNAVSAGEQDPRFDAVSVKELPFLVYSVDILSASEPIASMADLDVKRYGVIVSSGSRRGLLLPNLDGVDTPEQQVFIALQKAGIFPHEGYAMERFEVVRHK